MAFVTDVAAVATAVVVVDAVAAPGCMGVQEIGCAVLQPAAAAAAAREPWTGPYTL